MVYRGKASGLRIALVASGSAAALIASAALLLLILPAPHSRAHYLIAGTAPTLIALGALLARTHKDRTHMRSLTVRRADSVT